jgi:hypothetical protein
MAFFFPLLGFPCVCLGLLVGLGGTVFWIWMLVDCLMKESSVGNEKIIWGIVIAFTHVLGQLSTSCSGDLNVFASLAAEMGVRASSDFEFVKGFPLLTKGEDQGGGGSNERHGPSPS